MKSDPKSSVRGLLDRGRGSKLRCFRLIRIPDKSTIVRTISIRFMVYSYINELSYCSSTNPSKQSTLNMAGNFVVCTVTKYR
jgi:hypothetical protein